MGDYEVSGSQIFEYVPRVAGNQMYELLIILDEGLVHMPGG